MCVYGNCYLHCERVYDPEIDSNDGQWLMAMIKKGKCIGNKSSDMHNFRCDNFYRKTNKNSSDNNKKN